MLDLLWRSVPITSLELAPKLENSTIVHCNIEKNSNNNFTENINNDSQSFYSFSSCSESINSAKETLQASENRFLFAGSGGDLKIFDRFNKGKLVDSVNVLGDQRIYGIRLEPIISYSIKKDSFFFSQRAIAFGGRLFCKFIFTWELNLRCDILKTNIEFSRSRDTVSREKSIIKATDWIHDFSWIRKSITEVSFPYFAIVYAHNFVEIRHILNEKVLLLSQSIVECILYCARFYGDSLDNLLVASGTVFNQALIWNPISKNLVSSLFSENKSSIEHHIDNLKITSIQQTLPQISYTQPVLHTLNGHKGVIFGIRFSKNGLKITTTSDDRTIRVWEFRSNDDLYSSNKCSIKEFVLFGHKARIWDCLILENYLVSISEDATCRIWELSPDNIYKTVGNYRGGHSGKNIWSVTSDSKNGFIITGGEDGGIRNWRLDDISKRQIG
ncbi:WD repeat-containing protein 6 [Smittium mucronatum]|uniref:WD repeat-containing protein 6 n=1 Tax=Smittium mucronatum TaxID=133383 RepID=A0A1R0GM80_9FUNG|nr:WD repeat-containing protein 6 [Smittium mucronatum]